MQRLLKFRCRLPAPPIFLAVICFVLPFSSRADAQIKGPPRKDFIPDLLMNPTGSEQVNYINELIERQWKEQPEKIEPSERCSDYTFIRRVSLDLIGRIAKPHEIEMYIKDPPRERRSRLVERLLDSPEFAQNFAALWTVHLLTRSGSLPRHQEELREWLAEKLTERKEKNQIVYRPDWSEIVTELLTATGKTNENQATNFILHHLGEELPQSEWAANGRFDMVPLTSRSTRLFLGLRTQCVQCHDNKFDGEWQQHHFWGMNAFFRQVDAPLGRPMGMVQNKKKGEISRPLELTDNTGFDNEGKPTRLTGRDVNGRPGKALKDNNGKPLLDKEGKQMYDPGFNLSGKIFFERRNTLLLGTDPTFLDKTKIALKPGVNRRKELAKLITGSPYFAKAFINRTWGHFFGRSFTKDNVDDFGEHNPVKHPELLDRLSEDFKKFHNNPRDLIRWICNSRAYSLSSVANKTNDKPEDEMFFSRMLLKSMSPEQLFDSLMVATQAKVAQSKDSRIELRQEWLKKLIANFGDDEGNEVSYNGTVVQALMLINGKDINDAIMDKENGTVANILKRPNISHKLAMLDIYMATFNRPPTEVEYSKLLSNKVVMFRPDFQKTVPLNTERDLVVFWTGYYQDLMWAALNTSEFILNH